MDDRDVAAHIHLTPPEQRVMVEQATALTNAIRSFSDAATKNDGTALHLAYVEMSEHMTYIGSVMQLKGTAAARALMERMQRGEA